MITATCNIHLRKKKKGCKGFRQHAFPYTGHPLIGKLVIRLTRRNHRKGGCKRNLTSNSA